MAGSDQTFVSLASRNEIARYFAVGGDDCFSSETIGTPTPAPTPGPTGTPNPTPTSDPNGGSGGGGAATPVIGFSATFNQTRGVLTINMSKRNVSAGSCTAIVRIGRSSNLANASGVEFDSEADRLVFSTRTTKRLSSSRGRIFLQGEFVGCPDGENVKSAPIDITPIYARTTRKGTVTRRRTTSRKDFTGLTVFNRGSRREQRKETQIC